MDRHQRSRYLRRHGGMTSDISGSVPGIDRSSARKTAESERRSGVGAADLRTPPFAVRRDAGDHRWDLGKTNMADRGRLLGTVCGVQRSWRFENVRGRYSNRKPRSRTSIFAPVWTSGIASARNCRTVANTCGSGSLPQGRCCVRVAARQAGPNEGRRDRRAETGRTGVQDGEG